MNDFIQQLQGSGDLSANINLVDVTLVLVVSFSLTMTIGWVYRVTHRGVSYSQ